MKYLVKQLKGTKAAAEALGVSQRTVERYVAGKFKRPSKDLRSRIEREVKRRWQPQIRAKAKKRAASTGGLVVSTRAASGSPPRWADRLFQAAGCRVRRRGAHPDRA
jgi:DNA-binding LacI/PurR family transcriptional regulator